MHVNIVTSDRGWILERLAQAICRRLDYVHFGDGPDPSAGIQYYVTYSSRARRLSPIEVAFFTHLEPEGDARAKFYQVAREVEHCVCMAGLYAGILREAGIQNVTTISPGVDLDAFQPKLRIGVVGRTYHTGRKGEALVAEVMDIPGIDWVFTGQGWPGPALDLPDHGMPAFYRDLDYVLVPALYEGGPMCVVEALACGTEVIAPAIGWVPEFPHVEYEAGNAADLRRVLLGLVEKKHALRAAVLDRSWDAWAEGHDRLFRSLAAARGMTLAPRAAARPARPRRAGLVLHGNEAAARGGPSVRVPRLAQELHAHGQPAEIRTHPGAAIFEGLDLAHVFNCWPPGSALDALRRAKRAGKATVFSPILLDFSINDLWEEALPAIFAAAEPGAAAEAALAPFRAALAARRAARARGPEPVPGFTAALREMASLTDQLVFLSERERARMEGYGIPTADGVVVRNPVDAGIFGTADPALFERETGLRDFVLCVARIEPRKNQLMLVHALRDTALPVVLVGHAPNPAYFMLVERHGGGRVHVLDRLTPNSPLLASAYAAAAVTVLPSWSEGASLAALEAAAAGSSLVLSDQSGEREYFGDHARYCDPGDPEAIRRAVLDAYETPRSPAQVARQKAFVAETLGWDGHRSATEAAYARAMTRAAARPAVVVAEPAPPFAAAHAAPLPMVFDVTTTANHSGRWTGIARVEAALALALAADPRAAIRFVAWNDKTRAFREVPAEAIATGQVAALLADAAPPPLHLPAAAPLVVAGSAWMQNAAYAEAVVTLAHEHALRLAPIIHDVIPVSFPFWFDDGYAPVFEQNLTMLLDAAADPVAVSQATRRDLMAFAARIEGLVPPDVAVLREGDGILQLAGPEDRAAMDRLRADFADRPFVLTVGAIHLRKNHRLLHDIWVRLAERMGERCPHLVIVGGVAWNGQEVARALRGDPRLSGRVTILDAVDDHALDWLYRHCLFTLYPSLYEGWGLPVAESLRYGKPCIASDVASVPEIAPGLVDLLDPLDLPAWLARVQFYATSVSARAAAAQRIAAGYRGVTWPQSARALIDLLHAGATRPPVLRPYVLGEVVCFADRVAAARIRGAGWHPFESWGCRARASRAELLFAPSLAVEEPLALLVEGFAPGTPDRSFAVRVLANDVPVAEWVFDSDALQVLHAPLPAGIAPAGGVVRITFERRGLASDGASTAGIGVARVALALAASVVDPQCYFTVPGRTSPGLAPERRRVLIERALARSAPSAAPRPAPSPAAPPPVAPPPDKEEPSAAAAIRHDFSAARLDALRLSGWYEVEREGRWSDGLMAEIRLPRPAHPARRLRLELDGRVYGTAILGPARLEVALAGGEAATLAYPDDGFRTQPVELDLAVLPDEAESAVVTLRRIDPVAPSELGEGTDARRLGLLLRVLTVVWI